MRVAVLLGGMSREREVSLRTGSAVLSALSKLGYDGVAIDPGRGVARDLMESAADVVFIALHGRYGEDGTMQGLCEILGFPYTGSGVLASSAAMDKIFTKRIFRASGLPTPDFLVSDEKLAVVSDRIDSPPFPPPYVVKPASEGSSIGMSIVHDAAQLPMAIRSAHTHDAKVLVERFVKGVEVTVAVIGGNDPMPLPVIQVLPKSGQYDYASKYTPGATEYIIPPRLPAATISDCQSLGLAAHRALGCSGMSRVDMIIGESGIEILEVNTIPGMTETSLLPKAARASGIEFHDLIDRIIRWGMEARR
ncbi:MAG: D-alanine--D-alanine ligase [Candidatus Hydrogenedentota bacterium]